MNPPPSRAGVRGCPWGGPAGHEERGRSGVPRAGWGALGEFKNISGCPSGLVNTCVRAESCWQTPPAEDGAGTPEGASSLPPPSDTGFLGSRRGGVGSRFPSPPSRSCERPAGVAGRHLKCAQHGEWRQTSCSADRWWWRRSRERRKRCWRGKCAAAFEPRSAHPRDQDEIRGADRTGGGWRSTQQRHSRHCI